MCWILFMYVKKNIGAWYRGSCWRNARYYNVLIQVAVPNWIFSICSYEFITFNILCLSQGLTCSAGDNILENPFCSDIGVTNLCVGTEDTFWWEGKQNGYTTPSHLPAMHGHRGRWRMHWLTLWRIRSTPPLNSEYSGPCKLTQSGGEPRGGGRPGR